MPRSLRHLWRRPPAPNPQDLYPLLQQCPAASILGQGCDAYSSYPAVRQHLREADPRRTSPSILPDVVLDRDNSDSGRLCLPFLVEVVTAVTNECPRALASRNFLLIQGIFRLTVCRS